MRKIYRRMESIRYKAILKWSGIGITAGRGKIGGTVLSYNRGGAYMKNKVTPINPSTTAQANARARVTSYSQSWKGLTAAQISAWNYAASATANQFPYVNSNGDTYFLSGQELYIALNTTLEITGTAAITSPPVPQTITMPLTLSGAAAAGAQTFTLTFTATPIPANTEWLVFATNGMSPGISFFKNKLRFITSLPAATATGASIAAAYIAKYGVIPAAGSKIGISVVPVSTVSGQQGSSFLATTIVSA